MAAHRPELYTEGAVLQYYTNQPATMYRIFAGMVPDKQFCRFQYLDSKNKDAGYEQLRLALESIKSDKRNTNPYVLQVIDSITDKTSGQKTKEVIDAINIGFKLNDENYIAQPAAVNGQPLTLIENKNEAAILERMFSMMEENNRILSQRLTDLETKFDTEEGNEPEPTGKEKVMGAIGNILQKPKVQEAAAALIIGFASKFMTNKNENNGNW